MNLEYVVGWDHQVQAIPVGEPETADVGVRAVPDPDWPGRTRLVPDVVGGETLWFGVCWDGRTWRPYGWCDALPENAHPMGEKFFQLR